MSQLLSEWLNREIKLSHTVKPVEMDNIFRSGFLFGELLSHFNLQKDFPSFSASRSTDAWIANYIKLEPTLRQLNIPFHAQIVRDLMQGKPGTAAKLLYQLKITLPKLQQQTAMNLAKSNYSFGDSASPDQRSYPSSPKRTSAKISKSSKVPIVVPSTVKTLHDLKEHDFFVDNLKSKTKRIDHDLEEIAMRYQKFQLEQETNRLKSMEEKKAKMLQEKLERLQKIREVERQRSKLQRSEISHGKIPKTQVELTKIEMERLREEKIKKRLELSKKLSFQTYHEEVEEFERTNMLKNDQDEDDQSFSTKKNSKEFAKRKVDHTHHQNESIKTLEKAKSEDSGDEKEHSILREKKLLSQIHNSQGSRFKESEEDQLFVRLIHESEDERKLAAEISAVRREKEIMIRNRLFREQQYQEQREKDLSEAWRKEEILSQQIESQYKKDAETILIQHMQILEEKDRKKKEKNRIFCNDVVKQIIDLSIKMGEYRTLNDGYIPVSYYQKWMRLFESGSPIDEEYDISVKQDKVEASTIVDPKIPSENNDVIDDSKKVTMSDLVNKSSIVYEGIKLLDEKEFQDYYYSSGPWANSLDSAIPSNPLLTKIIDNILKTNTIATPINNAPKFPTGPLKISFIGKPFSGKSSIAKQTSADLGLQYITIEATVQSFIKKYSSTNEADKSELAKNASSLLSKGQPLDDNIIIPIMIQAIKEANDQVKRNEIQGYVLDDFPRTRNQAQILEKELTGYEEPKVVKPGNLKRGLKPPAKERRKSVLALTPGLDNDAVPPVTVPSCIDVVFLMQVPNATAVERASGRRLDPLTGTIYHLQHNPPPKTDPSLSERLIAVSQDEVSHLQIQLNMFEEQEDQMIDWFSRFQNIRVIDGSPNELKSIVAEVKGEIRKAEEKKERDKLLEAEMKENVTKEQAEQPNITSTNNSNGASAVASQMQTSSVSATNITAIPNELQSSSRPVTAGKKVIELTPALSPACAEILADKWASLENTYMGTLKYVFRSLRREKDVLIRYLFKIKEDFKKYLTRPDNKQDLVEDFQVKYNAFDNEYRADADCKAELHQRASDLQDKLWELTEKRKDEGEQERISILTNRYMEDHIAFVSNFFIAILQLELDRHVSTLTVAQDYYRDYERKALPPAGTIQTTTLSMSSYLEDSPSSVSKKIPSPKVSRKQATNLARRPTDSASFNEEVMPYFQYFQSVFNQVMNLISSQIPGGIEDYIKSLELSPESTSELMEIFKVEDQVARKRFDAIKDNAFKMIKEIYLKCQDSFNLMDEWNVQRYHGEMKAIRDLINVIRDSIEVEIQMTNQFVLMGDKFHVDLQALNFEPEAPPPPPQPVEQIYTDQFTVQQLQSVVNKFRSTFPDGFIPAKSFLEFLQKQAALSTGSDLVPDQLMNMDYSTFAQFFANQDPFDSGFLNWKKFVIAQAKILPISQTILSNLNQEFTSKDIYSCKGISRSEFMAMNLWFERPASAKNGFDRSSKLKELLCDMFERVYEIKSDANEGQLVTLFDYQSFMSHTVLDSKPFYAIRKAMLVKNNFDNMIDLETVIEAFKSVVHVSIDTMREDRQEDNTFIEPVIESIKTIFTACLVESKKLDVDFVEGEGEDASILGTEEVKKVTIKDFVDAYETQTLSINNLFLLEDLLSQNP